MYSELVFDTTYRDKVTKLLAGTFKIAKSGKLVPKHPQGARGIPWIFTNYNARRKHCSHWNSVYCGEFGLIPVFCRTRCWKTVVKPRNVKELFQLFEVFKMLDLPSKCGMDLRKYTYGAWAGFIYGDSLEQGLEYYKKCRTAVNREMSNRVPVILKRGCTEMERIVPSDQWDKMPKDQLAFEHQLDDLFEFGELHFNTAGWLKREIKERWIERAIEIGDPTARETAEKHSGDPDIWDRLVVHSVTYHKEK